MTRPHSISINPFPSEEGDDETIPDSSSSISSSASSSGDSDDSSTSSSNSSSSNSSDSGHEQSNCSSPLYEASKPTVEPYVGKMERFELFSTAQCYYLIASDKAGSAFRVLKMDRTLIELPPGSDDGVHYNANMDDSTAGVTHRPTSSNMDHQVTSHRSASDIIPPINATNSMTSQSINQNSIGSSQPSHIQPQSQASMEDQHSSKPTLRKLSEFCFEDPNLYSAHEIRQMLDMIHDGDRTTAANRKYEESEHYKRSVKYSGLKPIVKAHGIVGFIRFLDCYYLTLITKKSKVGSIGGNDIYTIRSTETYPLKPAEAFGRNSSVIDSSGNDPSSLLLNMWNRGKRSLNLGLTNRELAELRYQGLYQVVDLNKDFFFSYTYDMTRSLQDNTLAMTSKIYPPPMFKDMYCWNFFQTRELEEITQTMTSFQWIMPLVHGAFSQRKIQDYGRCLNLTLLARRSRHFAGTRYLKRGVSEQGKVANDVEHEQILHDETASAEGTISSFLQMRGSIPTYWTQESSVTMPKPPIVLNRVDPTYQATQAHFEDLLKRYGSPIMVVDLVKQSEKREREVIVGNEYRHAIDYLNCHVDEKHKVRYCALDYSHISKHRNLNVSSSLQEVATWAVNQTGFFCSAPRWQISPSGCVEPFDESNSEEAALLSYNLGAPFFPMEQKGVMRTNCIDCLDRTNVAQFSAGTEALAQQLVVMGIRSVTKLDSSSNIVKMLIDMYVEIGDHISLQYGGSEAHKKGGAAKVHGPMGKHKELLTSIRRYYSNAFTDRLKQDAMNLFLGFYIPSRHTVPLWDLDSDYYLHNFHVKQGKGSAQSMNKFRQTFAVNWDDDKDTADHSLQTFPRKNPIRLRQKSASRDGLHVAKWTKNEESVGLYRSRQRCKIQYDVLSIWWKVAVQSYIQQRMWMQLGHRPSEFLLPSRFERIYQPTKLIQFDKIFSRAFAKPMRMSHSSTKEDDTDFLMVNRKKVHSSSMQLDEVETKSEEGSDNEIDEGYNTTALGEFINEHGYTSASSPNLSNFLKYTLVRAGNDGRKETTSPNFVGSNISDTSPCDEYIRYVQGGYSHVDVAKRKRCAEEFSQCLRDTLLESDDVDGILKLAESAHLTSDIKSGPYRGLSEHESAIEVTSVVHEQFNALENMKARSEFNTDSLLGVNEELKRRQMDTPGVMESVHKDWNSFAASHDCYKEITRVNDLHHHRSDLTDEKSIKLYCSFFDDSSALTEIEKSYISGTELAEKKISSSKGKIVQSNDLKGDNHSPLLQRAKMMGFPMINSSDGSNNTFGLFTDKKREDPIPSGFEQINEDLYARKDNRFMVFNDAGVENWPPRPVTKAHGKLLLDYFGIEQ